MTRQPLYTHQYFDIAPGHVRRPTEAIKWQEGLPPEWADQVIAPLYFDHYMDYQIAAARILGRDEDDHVCYCAHSFVLESPATNGVHRQPAAMTYAESLRAWRLRDGRWLTHRVVVAPGATDKPRGFFALSNTRPA